VSSTQTGSKPRVIAAVGTWNEADFLPRWFEGLEGIADGVVVVDDGSSDDTVEVLRSHSLTLDVVAKPRGKRAEVRDRREMTKMALDHGADWILFLDADEIFDGRIRDVMPELIARHDVGMYRFRKFTLWRGEDQLRLDRPEKFSAWSPYRMVRASRRLHWRYDDGSDLYRAYNVLRGRTRWRPQFGHGGMAGLPGPVVDIDSDKVVIVHYASVSYPDMIWKQLAYAVGESREHPRRPADDIADYCFRNLDETTLEVGPLPPEWGPLP
jgi:glycosyltransferase involved in cell wall biosynthesis